ncbi:MAG: HD-GYP domain-containing protein [Phycisphaerae bacterium]|nr:HD-GYP domain-containing protein [Phycisphaerae bacterium]
MQPLPDPFAATFDALSGRCAALGVPLWRFDSNGLISAWPMLDSPLRQWLCGDGFRGKLEAAARMALLTKRIEPTQLFPGATFVPMEERDGGARFGLIAVVIFTEEVLSELNVFTGYALEEKARQQLLPLVRSGKAHRDQTIATVQWSYADLLRGARDNATLEQFGEKLSQSYEETALLFRLSRLLSCVGDPTNLVRTFVHQVQEIMPFGWLGIRFDPRHTELRDLATMLVLAGEPPCGVAKLDRAVVELVQSWGADDWTRVLRPRESALADVAGSEVLAEPITFDGKVIGGLFAGNKRGKDPEVGSEETQFIDAAASFLGIFHENAARFSEQRAMFMGVLNGMTAAVDAKDTYTCGHSERVGLLASRLATAAGLSTEQAERYRLAGLVHDVGKIGVSESVLSKTGRLTDAEFAQMKKHPEIGYQILRDIPLMDDILPGVLHHHERYDGKGYPTKLAGEDIPLIARVLALADTFDAMSSTRSYRPAMPRDAVLAEIKRCSGTQFDPTLAAAFVALDFSEFDELLARHHYNTQHKAAAA